MRVAATVQYDGSAFCGFQIQKNDVTIQAELEKAISTVSRQKVKVHGSGRTDTGVHSYGQVIHFDIEEPKAGLQKFIYSANAVLPKEISIIHALQVHNDFHARFSCIGREYIYRILNSRYRMALYEKNSFWQRKHLDIQSMQAAANELIGEHNFAAFTQAVYLKKEEKTIRRIDEINLVEEHPFLILHFRASGFLHNMIRIISGTLLSVGLGEMGAAEVRSILLSKNRDLAGVTLPARALFFYRAHYKEYETPADLLPKIQ